MIDASEIHSKAEVEATFVLSFLLGLVLAYRLGLQDC